MPGGRGWAGQSDLAQAGAEAIGDGFARLRETFDEVTRRALGRFEDRDWHGIQADAVERLGVYRQATDRVLERLRATLDGRSHEQELWTRLRRVYSSLVESRSDRVLAETFFNSITRRVFTTVGVDPAIEFVESDFDPAPAEAGFPVAETLHGADTGSLVRQLLGRFAFRSPWVSFEEDVRAVAAAVEQAAPRPAGREIAIDFVPTPFFRNQGAYLVGRLRVADRVRPLLLALLHRPQGVMVDAALLDENDAALVFSYTRSYFLVEVDHPAALVAFLRTLMPSKRPHELWTSLGFNKHGKTELYRDLLRHLRGSSDAFEHAPGQRGLVMVVFTLPSYDVVFKVIRDRIERPKETDRERVMGKYQLVFRHDRAGRLVDAQEFEHLEFDRERFDPRLLRELLEAAGSGVAVHGDRLEIRHLYTERRLTPLDVYLRQAEPAEAEQAVLDYGAALRDLAATNIFPGDLLLKNFGVTRQRRVVFYDYDELSLLSECRFRELPAARSDEDEMAGEPWYYVAENDMFPEEFLPFMGFSGRLRELFLEAHGELLRPGFWWDMQARLQAGELPEIFPYPSVRRLAHRATGISHP